MMTELPVRTERLLSKATKQRNTSGFDELANGRHHGQVHRRRQDCGRSDAKRVQVVFDDEEELSAGWPQKQLLDLWQSAGQIKVIAKQACSQK
jgi:hypothetical protein